MAVRPTHSLILRIYHRNGRGTHSVMGVVESVASGRRTAFRSASELWEIVVRETHRGLRQRSRDRH